MGVQCPECNTYQPYKAAIGAPGQPIVKSSDIFGYVLGCGHTVGGEQFEEFKKQSHDIDVKAYTDAKAIQDAANAKKAALWNSLTADIKEA